MSCVFICRPLPSSWNLQTLHSPLVRDPFKEMYQLYFEKLVADIPRDFLTAFNPKSDIRYVYSAMHGVGYRFIEEAFKIAHLKPVLAVKEQRDPDPEFPTVKFPNPEEGKSSLLLSVKHAGETSCKQILANDPDADRLALAEHDEKLV